MCPERTLDVQEYLNDPLMVATGSSWRRILHESGKPAAVPCNSGLDSHPDLEANSELLQLMASAPELFESTAMLLNVVQRLLENKPIKCLDETIEFARNAVIKAQKPALNQVARTLPNPDREAAVARYLKDAAWRDAWGALANHPTKRKEKYPLQTQQEYIEMRAERANQRIARLLPILMSS